jgi:hypothetical protein
MSLTTLADVKTYMGITGTEQDALLAALVSAASAKIEAYCDRTFAATNYREWFNYDGERTHGLRHRPIISVNRIATGNATGLHVSNTANAMRAWVSVTSDSIRLNLIDGDGVSVGTTLPFATHQSMAAMVTAINAVSGWSAVLGRNAPSADLIAGAYDATERGVQLVFASEPLGGYTVDNQSAVIGLSPESFVWELPGFAIGERPLRGFRAILVEYRAGYETIPSDLAQIAIEFVKAMYDESQASAVLQSESLGDYTYSLAAKMNLDAGLRMRLAAWSRIR